MDENARVLVLGSMPGMQSLNQQQYYAHPRNAFWPIITAFFGSTDTQDYSYRYQLLKKNYIALWDVLKSCQRPGSLDQNIKVDSIVANDFIAFFQNYPAIKQVFFNGGKAEQLFKRYVSADLLASGINLQFSRLPSTSPAHAGMSFAQKCHYWHEALALSHQ